MVFNPCRAGSGSRLHKIQGSSGWEKASNPREKLGASVSKTPRKKKVGGRIHTPQKERIDSRPISKARTGNDKSNAQWGEATSK